MTVCLTKAEAGALFAMEKPGFDEQRWRVPDKRGAIAVPLASAYRAETFHLDTPGSLTASVRNHGITPVVWSQRDQFRERLIS